LFFCDSFSVQDHDFPPILGGSLQNGVTNKYMNYKLIISLLSFTLLFLFISCKKEVTTTSGATDAKIETIEKPKLLAFLNPNGMPCQQQIEILNQVNGKLPPTIAVKKILTTNEQDLNLFYQYGVRSLPSLILINGKGDVINRLSPGIQDETAIINVIKSCQQC